jgi:hypothetical protein
MLSNLGLHAKMCIRDDVCSHNGDEPECGSSRFPHLDVFDINPLSELAARQLGYILPALLCKSRYYIDSTPIRSSDFHSVGDSVCRKN